MSKTMIYFHVYIILNFPITYRNASVLCQSECTCLHKTVNMVVFFVKSNENTYPKGRALMHMYRVVPITKRVNYKWHFFVILHFLPYRGTYILQPKAFISTGFVLSGPKLKIVVQPDPSRPSSLNVEYDTKYTLIVGQSMPGTQYMYILFKGTLFAQKFAYSHVLYYSHKVLMK